MPEAPHRKHWTWEEYLDWESNQPTKHELVDGEVIAMVGGTSRHDLICNNLRRELSTQLRGKRCRLQGPDLKVRAGTSSRYPDALIDCGPLVDDAVSAQEPAAVFEVLSKSTAWIDQTRKLRDYDSTPTIRYYVLISQDELRVLVYARDEAGRLGSRNLILLETVADTLLLPDLGIAIPLPLLYEGLAIADEARPAS